MNQLKPQRLIRLSVSGFKRIIAVEIPIDPDKNTLIVTGENGAGKSSIIEAVEFALFGKRVLPPMPINNETDTANVEIEFSDFIIQRIIKRGKNPTLTIRPKEGIMVENTESWLQELVGKVAFDPLKFMDMKPDEQRVELMNIAGLDFSELDARYDHTFVTRRDVNRDVTNLEGQIAGFDPIPADTPDEPVDINLLFTKLQGLEDENRRRENTVTKLEEFRNDLVFNQEELIATEERVALLKSRIKAFEGNIIGYDDKIKATPIHELQPVKDEIGQMQITNSNIRTKQQQANIITALYAKQAMADTMTLTLESIKRQKKQQLAAAKFPVKYLSLTDEGSVRYKKLPLNQASQGEQLKISTEIAMALNPKARVVVTKDASRLDKKNMALMSKMADEHGCLLIMERVESETGIEIVDGRVK